MLEFEDKIPPRFTQEGVIVKDVGELIEELKQLPAELPLSVFPDHDLVVSVEKAVRTLCVNMECAIREEPRGECDDACADGDVYYDDEFDEWDGGGY